MKGTARLPSPSVESVQLREGLRELDVRLAVRIIGLLRELSSDRARRRVLRFVEDQLDETADLDAPRAGVA